MNYILCLIVLNIAVVINSCLVIDIFDGFYDMLLRAFYLFIELLTVKENAL